MNRHLRGPAPYLASTYLGTPLQSAGERPVRGARVPILAMVGHRVPEFPAYTLITMPDAGLQPFLEAIARARYRVRLKIFILREPQVVHALRDCVRRGVECRVLLNPRRLDGTRENDESFRALAQAGVPVAWAEGNGLVCHEKFLVVDDVGYICTFNLAPKYYSRCRGYAVATRRPEEVEELMEAFETDWAHQRFNPRGCLVWSGGRGRQTIADLIDSARDHLDLQHPKLLDISILDRLLAALDRGVRIRFLSSGQKGVNLEDLLENSASLRILERAGAHVHRLKKPRVHAKLVMVDGEVAQLGSMNLARHCFEMRQELGIILRDQSMLDELARVFESDWANSDPWTPPDPLTMPYLERGFHEQDPLLVEFPEGLKPKKKAKLK